MNPTIRVRIDTLVLDGLPVAPGNAAALRRAIETALAERLAAPGFSAELLRSGAPDRLRVGTIELRPGASPAALGTQIGRALAGRLEA